MIRINQLKLPVSHRDTDLVNKICKTLHIKDPDIISYEIHKRSLDARKKPDLFYSYVVDVEVTKENAVLKRASKDKNINKINHVQYSVCKCEQREDKIRPIIVGDGPAGLFCAYVLTLSGLKPLVIERGSKIEKRKADVDKFWETGDLDIKSNVQFGEGGAGTFSDGKLNTLVKDPDGRARFVLKTFVKYGADHQILYDNKPHIGTDVLSDVITAMREDMEAMGTTFLFDTCMTDYETKSSHVTRIQVNGNEWIDTSDVVLAIGHSARDTFRMLKAKNELEMSAKSFAVGFRVEHPQEMISLSQYGDKYYNKLPAAAYKLTAKASDGRGVYSFCMCPGGYVVNASSEDKKLAVNGMSYSGRSGENANSAIIVSVTCDDFEDSDALAGLRFQEKLEAAAYELCDGAVPQQLFGDYCNNIVSQRCGSFKSALKGHGSYTNLRGLLPSEIEEAFIEGMHSFARSIPDFDREDCILSAIESRTSSPVRITRDDKFISHVGGIYPCGEGAGYAGGIMSAAMDGMKVAEAIINKQKQR